MLFPAKRWWLLLFVLAAICSGLLFWETISSSFFSAYLHRHFRKNFSLELSCDQLEKQGKNWSVIAPRFKGWLEGEAETMQVQCEWSWESLGFSVDVVIIRPSFTLEPIALKSFNKTSSIEGLFPKLHLGNLAGKLSLVDGVLVLQDAPNQSYRFELQGLWKSLQEGELTANLWKSIQENDSAPQIALHWIALPDQSRASLTFKKTDIPLLNTVFYKRGDWSFTNGQLDGSLVWTPPLQTIEGQLHLEHLTFCNFKQGVEGHIPSAVLHVGAKQGKQQGSIELIQPAHFAFQGNEATLKQIAGTLHIQDAEKVLVDLTASWQERPIRLTSEFYLATQKLQAHLNLFTEKQIDLFATWHRQQENLYAQGALQQNDSNFQFELVLNSDKPDQLYGHWLPYSIAVLGFSIDKGWFYGDKISAEEFPNWLPLKARGLASIEGAFDSNSLFLDYTIPELTLSDDHFELTFNLEKAAHYFEWNSGKHGGVFSIVNGNCRDLQNDFNLTGITGEACVNQEEILIEQLEGFYKDLFWTGSFQLTPLAGEVQLNTLVGQASTFQSLVKDEYGWLSLPLEGEISLREPGAMIHLNVADGVITFHDLILHAALADGVLPRKTSYSGNLSLHDLSCHIDYSTNQPLKISNLQGVLFVGNGMSGEEYLFSGEMQSEGGKGFAFDFWAGDRQRDLCRAVGRMESSEDDHLVTVILNENSSHFGASRLTGFNLVLRDWFHIERFYLGCDFLWKELWPDLKQFGQQGLFPLSKHLVQEIQKLSLCDGKFHTQIAYDDRTTVWTYDVTAKEVLVDTHLLQNCQLQGKVKDNLWIIDQLQVDQISLAGEFIHISSSPNLPLQDSPKSLEKLSLNSGMARNTKEHWRIPFFGLRVGEGLLLGGTGEYFPENKLFTSQVHLCEANLKIVSQWPFLQSVVSSWKPKGHLKIYGTSHLVIFPHDVRIEVPEVRWSRVGSTSVLKEIKAQWKPCDIRLSALWPIPEIPLTLIYQSQSGIGHGELVLGNSMGKQLAVLWDQDAEQGIQLRQIQGSCCGLNAMLKSSPKRKKQLEGEVWFKLQEMKEILPQKLQDLVSLWDVGGEFNLRGCWSIPNPISSWEGLSFQGSGEGKSCSIKGVQVERTEVQIRYQPGQLAFSNIQLKDSAGTATAQSVQVNMQSEREWKVAIPSLTISQLRMGLLQGLTHLAPAVQSWGIHKLEMTNLQGNLFDSHSWLGTGNVSFFTQNQNGASPIAEASAREGIDWSIVCPLAGSLFYEIADGKVYLTRCKNVYSSGHVCKWSLPKEAASPSYVDLDGNLLLQFRVQSGLLQSKFTNPFTLLIRGNLQHPQYSLSKVSK